MKRTTKLYHCTSHHCLMEILKTKYFLPSYCLESGEYLTNGINFAYAMVCFADLLHSELKEHLRDFGREAYICMSKKWAINNGVASVMYISHKSIISASIIKQIKDLYSTSDSNKVKDNIFGYFMAFFKQHEGYFWQNKLSQWSPNKKTFFTEREWRYVPLVKDREAFYLDEADFMNKKIRQEKQKELIDKGYALSFDWQNIETIGVKGIRKWLRTVCMCKKLFHISFENAISKVKLISFI